MTSTTEVTTIQDPFSPLTLTASDGHKLDAYLARPQGRPRGGVVISQEMYGVTAWLRGVCDFYASQGYAAIAPALYDRRQRGLVYAYNTAGHDAAQKTYTRWNYDLALLDLNAAQEAVADLCRADLGRADLGKADLGKVGFVGFCWGGTMAWLSACRRDGYACTVAYYGSFMPDYANERARCPVLAHVGDSDHSFPLARIAQFRAAQPDVAFHIYEGAPHAFANTDRADRYHPAAHKLARERTLEFLGKHIG